MELRIFWFYCSQVLLIGYSYVYNPLHNLEAALLLPIMALNVYFLDFSSILEVNISHFEIDSDSARARPANYVYDHEATMKSLLSAWRPPPLFL